MNYFSERRMYKSADTQLIANQASSDVEHFLSEESSSTLPLIRELCQVLARENVSYCHWKSNNALDRSASGDNDLDLLVNRADGTKFSEILFRLGFKQAKAPPEKQMPGVLDFYGYDLKADRLVHVHVHYQLVLGHDMTKNFRLPIERPYLESAVQGNLFRVPAPEFEFIVFVIRMMLKHATWDVILGGEGKLKPEEREEFAYLQTRVSEDGVKNILKQHLPCLNLELFKRCLQALQPGYSLLKRVHAGHQLQICLQPYARRPLSADVLLKLSRRVASAIRRRILRLKPKYRLENGGAMIAIIGGDGAGKSTAVCGLSDWLSKHFEITSEHMGKPAWSLTTILARGILKVGNLFGLYPPALAYEQMQNRKSLISPEYSWLLRQICTARDRHRTYRKARRFATNGGLVFLDRFPHPQIQLMDGPQGKQLIGPDQTHKLVRSLISIEDGYYKHMIVPDLTIVLRVKPEIAVQRKTDEKSSHVRERSTEVWELNWQDTDAYIIEAGKSKTEVLAELKAVIWSQL